MKTLLEQIKLAVASTSIVADSLLRRYESGPQLSEDEAVALRALTTELAAVAFNRDQLRFRVGGPTIGGDVQMRCPGCGNVGGIHKHDCRIHGEK